MKKDSKVAILGGRGMLGSDLQKELSSQGFEVSIYDLPELDICQVEQIQLIATTHDAIINCAAYTNVDGAETDHALAEAVNATAVKELAVACSKANCYLIHISTDFVFDGKGDTPWTETDVTTPLNVYGLTKLQGEQQLLENNKNAAIIRVQWTYGKSGNNFISKIIELCKNRDKIMVVADQVGAPTPTSEVAKAIADVLAHKPTGLYHYAASGYTSRYEVAKFIANTLGLSTEIAPCNSDKFPAPATRPLNSKFNCQKIDTILTAPRKEWQLALKEYLKSL